MTASGKEAVMTVYRARMQGYEDGSEGVYDFEERPDLMKRPADDVVKAFIDYAERSIFQGEDIHYELNGVMKHPPQDVVVGMGTLYRDGHPEGLPFTLIINPKKLG
jgi:hypothetical protein